METRPGIFVVGSTGVGKRTLLSRLLSIDFEDSSSKTEGEEVRGWTINTKYYTADVSVWISHICDDEHSLPKLPQSSPLVALVMVFDLTKLSTLVSLQDWLSHSEISSFDVLLCIGNKVDLVPHHLAHEGYRRRLCKKKDELGLGGEDASLDLIRGTCIEWCCENNIEFVEACASNPEFDKCLSVDGDSQGVERVFDALSAHMWPGMVLKSGGKIDQPVLAQGEELSEEESEYELEYQELADDPWENGEEIWVSASETHMCAENLGVEKNVVVAEELRPSGSRLEPQNETERAVVTDEKCMDTESNKGYEVEDVEQLMSEIGNIRENLRLMPDFQRREIAANLAMKMASMFGGDTDDEEEPE